MADEYRDTIIGARNRWGRRCMLNDVSKQWMFGVREQLDFLTLGTAGRSLGAFGPPPRPPGGDQLVAIEPPATTDDGARVQPIMNAFLRELRARAPHHSAWHYPRHGGGALNGRGFSIDLGLREAKDSRGFYSRPAAVTFLLAVDAAASAAGVEWRAIYNDYAVAATINRHLDRRRVVFVGQPRRGGRQIGLNWHGPLILHFHVDITPEAQAPTPSGEDFEWESDEHLDELKSGDFDSRAEDFEAQVFDRGEGEEFEHEELDGFATQTFAPQTFEADGEGESDNSLFGHFLLESAVADRRADEAASDFEPAEELAFSGEDEVWHELEGQELDEPPGRWECAEPVGVWDSDELVGERESAEAPFEPGLEQFSGSEHKSIGDKGSGGVKTALVYSAANAPLTFGDVVALAGDMYASYYDLAERSRSPEGRAELAWALWYALDVPKTLEPRVSDAVKKQVVDRYYALAAENISHFFAGGTGAATYMKWHAAAMADALAAGQNGDDHQWRIAIGKEAVGDHFLTDIFSAGHVRTPRAEIKEWYKQHGLGTSAPFVHGGVHAQPAQGPKPLVEHLDREWLRARSAANESPQPRGEALQSISLGDIVSLALHDLDNEGLDVVSKVDPTGRRPANGHHWRAIGDAHLPEPQGAATRQMVMAAVVVSFRDLARVRDAGRGIGKRNLTSGPCSGRWASRPGSGGHPARASKWSPGDILAAAKLATISDGGRTCLLTGPSFLTGELPWRRFQSHPMTANSARPLPYWRSALPIRNITSPYCA